MPVMHSAVIRAAGFADVVPSPAANPTPRVAFPDSRAQATADERQRNDLHPLRIDRREVVLD